mmetsp:Transcript_51053/g.122176  ORF Transcript_51053/g.122176 Transcript_51053/m.122176 type:complete len:124 (+) Transcript_51053:16-387(+)
MVFFDTDSKFVIRIGDKVLSYAGGSDSERQTVVVESFSNHPGHYWHLKNGYLTNANVGTCVTVDHDGSSTLLIKEAGADDQKWTFKNGQFISKANGKALTVSGDKVVIQDASDSSSQKFSVGA